MATAAWDLESSKYKNNIHNKNKIENDDEYNISIQGLWFQSSVSLVSFPEILKLKMWKCTKHIFL